MVELIVDPQLIGLIFIITGLIGYYFPPKKINDLYGYRTTASKKNQQTWDVANRFSAIYAIKAGVTILVSGLLLHFLISCMAWPEKTKVLLNVILLLASAIFSATFTLVATERHLKKTFDKTE